MAGEVFGSPPPPPLKTFERMDLCKYIDKHVGETAWIFGKGPSLKGFDFEKAGPLRCAINDVISYIPNCKYGFSNDGVSAWCDVYKPGQVLFQPQRCQGEFNAKGQVDCDLVLYEDCYDDRRIILPKADHAKLLTVRRGTLGSAIQILRIMGVSQIVCVGIDGGNAHADGFDWRTRLRRDHWKDYNAIRDDAIDGCELMGIKMTFYNQENKTMEDDGKRFVRMTRNCAVQGVHYPQGAIGKFTTTVIRQLIESDSAELFNPPVTNPSQEQESTENIVELAKIEAPSNASMQKRARPKKAQ